MSQHNQQRLAKRNQFSGRKQNNNFRLAIGVVLALGAVVVGFLAFGQRGNASDKGQQVVAVNNEVRIPLSDVNSGEAKFYQYTASNNKVVRFFVIKSSDGVYRAAADACDVCFRGKMGYHQEGDDMVCKKCGRHFASKDVNEVTGGCNPDGIPRTVQGNNLVIQTAELEQRTVLF
ncbi:MAG: DUF2318 domain-containing protein [Nitrospira sp.]|jgi:uncharacterized membrane protein|nr:DUF2318 domain-containing protein [Nitrospira sp.]